MTDISHLYRNPKTFVQWMGREHVQENNTKPVRLRALQEIIGFPADQNFDFELGEVMGKQGNFKPFLQRYRDRICVVRVIQKTGADKSWLRMRGLTVTKSLEWLKDQKVSPEECYVQYVFHSEKPLWSATFVVGHSRVVGEVIRGGHYQLTRGWDEVDRPNQFVFDFFHWRWDRPDPKAKNVVWEMLEKIKVDNLAKRKQLSKRMGVGFSHNYLMGYFETDKSEDWGLRFGDYNRLLVYRPVSTKGKVTARVRIVSGESDGFERGEVLVAEMTNPDFLPLIAKAAAVVTDQGGILSHAAIVAREWGIPCVVGTGTATKVLKNGDLVEVDANGAIVKIKQSGEILRGLGMRIDDKIME